MSGTSRTLSLVFIAAGALVVVVSTGTRLLQAEPAKSGSLQRPYTTSFRLADCTFVSRGDDNPYFGLEPGRQLILEGAEGKEEVELRITVLGDTQDITVPDVGVVRTRVVEEREWVDGELAEVSRNFFALCAETRDVFYFGEDVDNYEGGVIANHDGAWRAGVDGALPGLIMPGSFLLGSRYFQEIAPGAALDRGENLAMDLTVEVPAGQFEGCVSVFETSALESSSTSLKVYAPGIGLIVDDSLALVARTR